MKSLYPEYPKPSRRKYLHIAASDTAAGQLTSVASWEEDVSRFWSSNSDTFIPEEVSHNAVGFIYNATVHFGSNGQEDCLRRRFLALFWFDYFNKHYPDVKTGYYSQYGDLSNMSLTSNVYGNQEANIAELRAQVRAGRRYIILANGFGEGILLTIPTKIGQVDVTDTLFHSPCSHLQVSRTSYRLTERISRCSRSHLSGVVCKRRQRRSSSSAKGLETFSGADVLAIVIRHDRVRTDQKSQVVKVSPSASPATNRSDPPTRSDNVLELPLLCVMDTQDPTNQLYSDNACRGAPLPAPQDTPNISHSQMTQPEDSTLMPCQLGTAVAHEKALSQNTEGNGSLYKSRIQLI